MHVFMIGDFFLGVFQYSWEERADRNMCMLAHVRIWFYIKSKILSKRSGKSIDKFWGLGCSAPKSNPSCSGKPIIEGVGLKMHPAEMQAVPFRGLS